MDYEQNRSASEMHLIIVLKEMQYQEYLTVVELS